MKKRILILSCLTFFISLTLCLNALALRPRYGNTYDKDFMADAPWRVKNPDTPIPIGFFINNSDQNDLQHLDSVEVILIRNGEEEVVYRHDFDRITIDQRFWEHTAEEFRNSDDRFTDGDPITARALEFNSGDIIELVASINGEDDFWSPVDFSSRLHVYVGEEFPRPNNDWLYGDAHYHTRFTGNPYEYGAGIETIRLATNAIDLDWVTITDHASDNGWDLDEESFEELENIIDNENGLNGLPFILGEEITCQPDPEIRRDQIHLLVYNNDNFISGRIDSFIHAQLSLETRLQLLNDTGLAFAAHPSDDLPNKGVGDIVPWSEENYETALMYDTFYGLQIWNTRSTWSGEADDDNSNIENINPFIWQEQNNSYTEGLENSIETWVELLNNHLDPIRKIVIDAGSDAHGDLNYSTNWGDKWDSTDVGYSDNALGKVRTLVYAPGHDRNSVLNGIRNGNSIITDGPVLLIGIDTNFDNRLDKQKGDIIVGDIADICEDKGFNILIKWWAYEDEEITNIRIFLTDEEQPILEFNPQNDPSIYGDSLKGYNIFQFAEQLDSDRNYYIRAECTTNTFENDYGFDEQYRAVTNPIWLNVHSTQWDPSVKVLSPVNGSLIDVNSLDKCPTGKWCFNQHRTGYHRAGNGIGNSDDSNAWDANLNYVDNWDADDGEHVFSVADGIVEDKYAGSTNAGGNAGQLLIRHNYKGNTWWSGYLHLDNIRVKPGEFVTQDDIVGDISSTGSDNNHLHFVVYEGENKDGKLISFDTTLIARNGQIQEPYCINNREAQFAIPDPIFIKPVGDRYNGNIRVISTSSQDGGFGVTDGSVKVNGATMVSRWEYDGIYANIFDTNGLSCDSFSEPILIEVFDDNGDLIGKNYYPFSDLGEDTWFSRPIIKLWKEGVVSGNFSFMSNSFWPNQEANRAEYMAVALKAEERINEINKEYPPYRNNFQDVTGGEWYADYVQFVIDNDIMQACNQEETLFCPQKFVERKEAVKITTSVFDKFENTVDEYLQGHSAEDLFVDVTDPTDQFYPYIYVAKTEKLVSGYADGSFEPIRFITRGEMAKINCIAAFGENECMFAGEQDCAPIVDSPSVISVNPLTAVFQEETIFTIKGSNLPTSTALWIEDCAYLESLGGTSTEQQFRCIPSYTTGIKGGVVKDKPDGNELYNFTLDIIPKGSNEPSVTSVEPRTVMFEEETVFTVNGSNLSDTTSFWIDDCAYLESLGGTSTKRQFRCTPSYTTGMKAGLIKDNLDGNEMYSFTVDVMPDGSIEPSVTSVEPGTVMFEEETVFTVNGSNLSDTTSFWIDDCAYLESLGGTSTEQQFRCTPSFTTGTKEGIVKDQVDGNELFIFSIEVQEVPSVPRVFSVSPDSVEIDRSKIFTVTGENLTDTTAFFIEDCAYLENLGGDSTERYFQCTPSYTPGTKNGVVKDQPSGNELYTFTVDVSLGTPTVSSVSPTTAALNNPTTFYVKGTSLSADIAFWIGDCANIVEAGGTAEEWRFECTPSYSTGTKDGEVKDQPGGSVLKSFTVDIVQ